MKWSEVLREEVGKVIEGDDHNLFEFFYNVIDSMSEEFSGESFEARLDGEQIVIKMGFTILALNNVYHDFFNMIDNALSLKFKPNHETGNVIVEFALPTAFAVSPVINEHEEDSYE